MKRHGKQIRSLVLPLLEASLVSSCAPSPSPKNIYIAWSNKQDSYSFISTVKTIQSIGCNPVVLDMVKSNDVSYDENDKLIDVVEEHGILLPEYARMVKTNSWKNSNIEEVAKDIDCVVFPGGSDVCPTLRKEEGEWHGIEADTDYAAERDISDYCLMSYCLEKDIPVFAICRGMQMLSTVLGAKMIDDIPSYFAGLGVDDEETHRDDGKKVFAYHDVNVLDEDSLLYKTTGKALLHNVPSWHHQGVLSTDGTGLTVTGESVTNDVRMIEAVERKDLSFCLGVQFHPEVSVRKYVEKEEDANLYLDLETSSSFFKALDKARKM